MKTKRSNLLRFILLMLIAILTPKVMWAQTCSHEYNETTDPHHTVCTKCSHSFLRYTTQNNVVVSFPALTYDWMDAQGNVVTLLSNTNTNGEGIIEFGSPIVNIPQNRFYNRSELTSAIIPVSVKSIDAHAFEGCSNLATVVVPSSLTEIKDAAFVSCYTLSSIDIPNSVTSIGVQAFMSCSSLTSINVPTSLTSISRSAFKGCSGLTSVTIPGSVQSIGEDAFSGCSNLSSVTIGNSVKSIGQYAFAGCIKLQSITIPSSVESFGYRPFFETSIMTVTNERETPQTLTDELIHVFWYEQHKSFNTDYKFLTLNVPSAGYLAYKQADEWKRFGTIQCIHCTALTKTDAHEETCQATGNKEYWTCVCGKVYKDAEANQPTTVAERTIPKAHKLTKTAAVESTCTETGHMDYWTCSHCNKMFSDANGQNVTDITAMTTAAKGHDTNLANGICTRCSIDLTVKTSYKKPLFFTEGDASSGERDWEMVSNVTAIPLPSASTLQTWYAQTYVVQSGQTVTLSKGAICNGAVTLILEDGATLNVTGNENAGINVSGGSNSLTIYGQDENSGALTAIGGRASAGIGGAQNANGGNITINGGTITAKGTNGGAGIGGGACTRTGKGQGYNIVINGGKIVAQCTSTTEEGGAGIGGGRYACGRNIIINGGEIKATGGKQGAGIGGGARDCGYNILFNGGYTIAEGKNNASGIGNGSNTRNILYPTKNGYIKFADKMGVKTHTDIIETTSDDMFATINGMSSINVHEHKNFTQDENSAKCTEYGTKSTYCGDCQKNVTITDYYQLPSPGHHGEEGYTPTYVWGGTYDAPTCLFTLKCNKCDKNVVTNKPLTTSKVSQSHVDPGCTTTGNETWTATGSYENGGDIPYNDETAQTNNYVIPALGHALTKTEAKPSCTEVGHKAYWTCSACSKVFADDAGTEETTVEAQTVQITGHSFTFESDAEAYLLTAATCAADAVYYHKCANCTESSKDRTNSTWTKTGSITDQHTFTVQDDSESYLKSEAICGDDAVYYYKCAICSVSSKDKTDTTWAKTGTATGQHNFTSEEESDDYLMTAATCTDNAVYYHKCANCTASSKDHTNTKWTKTGTVIGSHSYTTQTDSETYLKTPATCNEDEVYYHKCANCSVSSEGDTNSTWTKTGTALGHGSEGYNETYTWSGDCYNDDSHDTKACNFTLQCKKCSTNVVDGTSLDCTKTAHTDAGCTTTGSTTYSVTGTYTAANSSYNYSKTDTHDFTIAAIGHMIENGICSHDGCQAREVIYRVPTYNTADTPSSGIKSWSIETAAAYPMNSSNSQWTAGWYYVAGDVTLGGAVCSGDVHLILCDECTLTANSGNNAGIRVSGTGNSLTIYAQSEGEQMGTLLATGVWNAAGIGGGDRGSGSHITINGGIVNSKGSGAGIGGGANGSGSYITINGGTVTATSSNATSNQGAGIGGGINGSGSYITINGGTVTATGADSGAGIGGCRKSGSYITITGGTVTANGNQGGAGIGGGRGHYGSHITITGGTVTANGSRPQNDSVKPGTFVYGAGIGNGSECETAASHIYISKDLITLAGTSENPTDEILHYGSDLTSDLNDKCYVLISPEVYETLATATITDGEAYSRTTAAKVGTLTYKRTVSESQAGKWQALYVPFQMSYDDWSSDFDVATIQNFHEYTDDAGAVVNATLEVRLVKSGTLMANHPYLIRPKTVGEKVLTVQNTTLARAKTISVVCQSTEKKYTFTGSYAPMQNLKTPGYLFLTGGKLMQAATDQTTLKAQRWYLDVENTGSLVESVPSDAKAISISVIDEDVTDIEEVRDESLELRAADAVYNLNGQQIPTPQKGVNIIRQADGEVKKVMVK